MALPRQAFATWSLQTHGIGQKAGYFQISAADATHAMAVGTHDTGQGNQTAVIAITSDGMTWQQKQPDSSPIAFYLSVHMASPKKAFVGMIGKVLVTQDGGKTFTPYTEAGWGPLKGPSITGIGFANEQVGYLVGSSGTLRKTTDGGATFTPLTGPQGIDWSGIFVLDADHIWLWAGQAIRDEETDEITGYEGGTLAFSTDGGATFTIVFQGEARSVARVFMVNRDEGYMISNSMAGPRLEHTTDGGRTWASMPLPQGDQGAPDAVLDIFFFDLCEGFLIQERNENTQLMYTTDRGATWSQVPRDPFKLELPFPIPVYARFLTFDFPSREAGFAGGAFETLAAYTADGPGPGCGSGTPDGGTSRTDGGSGDGGSNTDEGGGCGCRMPSGRGTLNAGMLLFPILFLARGRRRT